MIDRPHAFGEQTYSLLDNVIFFLRKRQVIRNLPTLTNQTIADLGAGFDARLLCSLLAEHSSVKALAIDMAFDQTLASKDRLTLLINDLDTALAIPDSSVDICLSLAVLEHLNHPLALLTEMRRILKPGGTVVLTTPGPTSKPLLEFLAFKLKIIDADEIRDHKNYFSSTDLQRMFEQAGFKKENVNPKTFIFGMNNVVIVKRD